jgi:hypothetical protein
VSAFPSLEPSARSFDLGEFPVVPLPRYGRNAQRFLQGSAAYGQQLTLTYGEISDADAQLLRDHYNNREGEVLAFFVPDIIWQGHTGISIGLPFDGWFRYAGEPQEQALDNGQVTMTVQLRAINDPTIP